MNREQAHYLLTSEAFQELISGERMSALERLASHDVADVNGILRLQQRVAVIDDLRFELERLTQDEGEAPTG